MIPNVQKREVITDGNGETSEFGIHAESQAHIMSILRDRLYTDKILAVLREYSANAWDANREAGRGHQPISVHVPTDLEPSLVIRDHGLGLSPEGMRKVYTQYGNSTKRASNNAVGMLGIGSKSGFAYASSFTVTSFHGGTKYIYNAVLDPSNKGVLQLMHEEPCDVSDTGVEVQIFVKKNDIFAFQMKAQQLFRFFEPRPSINIELPAAVKNNEGLKAGVLTTDETRWIAVMGCVPYHINLNQLHGVPGFDCDNHDKFGGILNFNIGEVDVAASREELEYNDRTKMALVDKFNALVDEYVLHVIKKIEQGTGSTWEKRLAAQELNKLGLAPEGDMFAKWVVISDVVLKKFAGDFGMWHGSELARTVNINPNARIVVRDEFQRSLSGYRLNEYDYLVKPASGCTSVDRKRLDELISALKIEGIAVVDLSTVPWYPKRQNRPKEINPKHRVRTFKLTAQDHYYKPYAANWETETERTATDTDIYVVLANFVSPSYHFYGMYKRDRFLAKTFGGTMPEVFGYKTTEKRPAQPVGIEYAVWSEQFRKSLMTDANCALLKLRERAKSASYEYYGGYSCHNLIDANVFKLSEELGKEHVIVQFFLAAVEAKKQLRDLKVDNTAMDFLAAVADSNGLKVIADERKLVKGELETLKQLYPLLTTKHACFTMLVQGDDRKLWIDYVKLADKVK